jgi:pimeloyl-ACP methyl ester carboxylesterase
VSRSAALGEAREVRIPAGTIRYREKGSGRPIVFVHGILVNGDLWRQVAPALSADFRCIVPDWPLGSHELPLNANADLSPPGVARIVADFIAALELQDVTVVGNDTGGAITQILVTEHPERIGGLVLTSCDAYENFLPIAFRYLQWISRLPGSMSTVAATLRVPALHRTPLVFGLVTKRPIEPAIRDSYFDPVRRNADVRRDLRKLLREISKRYTLAAADKLERFDQPALVAWAAEDRIFPSKHGERLATALPQGRLELIEDSYAFIPEDQPARLAELIAGFMREPVPTR